MSNPPIFNIAGPPECAEPVQLPVSKPGGLTRDGTRAAVAAIDTYNQWASTYAEPTRGYNVRRQDIAAWNRVAETAATLDATPEMFITVVHAVWHINEHVNKSWGIKAVKVYQTYAPGIAKRVGLSRDTQVSYVKTRKRTRELAGIVETDTAAAYAVLSSEPTGINPVMQLLLADRMRFSDIVARTKLRACAEYVGKRYFYDASWGDILPPWLPHAADAFVTERVAQCKVR